MAVETNPAVESVGMSTNSSMSRASTVSPMSKSSTTELRLISTPYILGSATNHQFSKEFEVV